MTVKNNQTKASEITKSLNLVKNKINTVCMQEKYFEDLGVVMEFEKSSLKSAMTHFN